MTASFYRDLPVIESFPQAIDSASHAELPDDWWIVVTDVVGSTLAIERGLYKHVNNLGVATIVAIINVDRTTEIPYVFGGDGCICAVPPEMEAGVRSAIMGCKALATEAFELELRAGMIRASELKANRQWLLVGKSRTSQHMLQATLSGRGWETAEALIKNPNTRARYEVASTDGVPTAVDLSGYQCRWQGLKPKKGFTLCVLVQCLDADGKDRAAMYGQVLAEIDRIFGRQDKARPFAPEALRLSFLPRQVWKEACVHTVGRGLATRVFRFFSVYLQLLIGSVALGLKLPFPQANWGTYRDTVLQNTDYRKFDGTLKLLLDCTAEEASAFNHFLGDLHGLGRLVYGLHRSAGALITCMIFSYQDAHFHFVDGDDGGYAMAAKAMKRQLAAAGLGGEAKLAGLKLS